MFTENEISSLIDDPEIKQATFELKKDFIQTEAQFLEISDHDFLSLVILTPSVGISLANGSVSLFEEISLNKKARKLSKGGYFMKRDPVVVAMGFLIKKYDAWADKFYAHLKMVIAHTLNVEELMDSKVNSEDVNDEEFCLEGLKSPFIFIRYLTSFFLDDEEEDLVAERNISRVEMERVMEIAHKLEFDKIPLFLKFTTKLKIR